MTNGSRSRLEVIKFTITKAKAVNMSNSGLLLYSSMHFMGIVPDMTSSRKFEILPSESKWCCHVLVTHLPSNHPLIDASSAIETGIHLVDVSVAVTGLLLALATLLVYPNVARKPTKTLGSLFD